LKIATTQTRRLAPGRCTAGVALCLLGMSAATQLGCVAPRDDGLYGDGFLPVELPGQGEPDPGGPVTVSLQTEEYGALAQRLSEARALGAAQLRAQHAPNFVAGLDYAAVSATGLELIQASALSLTTSERARLVQTGFVILPRHEYPGFPYAYDEIYSQDLPVFVSADMILEAVHRSYDSILQALEQTELTPRLDRLLSRLSDRLASARFGADDTTLAADLDLYLTVGRRLLGGATYPPVRGADAAAVSDLVERAEAGKNSSSVELFGTERELDFSQFEPRGHYRDDAQLERYFRAMIWFGRADLRLIETLPSGARVLRRRQLDVALGLGELMDSESLADWNALDTVIGAFAGEHDYMTVPELDGLLAKLGVSERSRVAELDDSRVAQTIVGESYGAQRIASQLMSNDSDQSTLALDASFALFGQRYVVDSHVLSNVVYDRVPTRVRPNSLDVAFAALGNDQALELLSDELELPHYAGQLAAMRTLVEAHPAGQWQSNLYTSWLAALRTLSPDAPGNALSDEHLPTPARTELWGRRLLNTQLGSWAQLRHDTILYAKQSYTTGSLCEFPDAYVDPYPEFFHALGRFAELGQRALGTLELGPDSEVGERIRRYFESLAQVMGRLGRMAEAQRTGAPHSVEDVAFINQAIALRPGCGGFSGQDGWYAQLFFDDAQSIEQAPTIADVHSDPGGDSPVARNANVLHVGTGLPRLMVTVVDSCTGPRAYVGAVFDYQEQFTDGLTRLTDEEWGKLVGQGVRWEPAWMAPTFAPE
jgi:hypothetical protein